MSGHEGAAEPLAEEPTATRPASGLREEEIALMVQAEVKAGMEQIMAELAGKFETMERVMTML